MLNTPFSCWPSFSEEEVNAVAAVIRSNKVNYWTGDECRKFEQEFAAWVGVEHAVSLCNGTVALDVALKALNIGPGDEVIVTPRTFLASVSCVVNAGATPVFADVDLNSQNLTAESINAVRTSKTKAVIVVHLAGMPADMDPAKTRRMCFCIHSVMAFAMIFKRPHNRPQRRIVGCHHATFATCRHNFVLTKRPGTNMPDSTNRTAFVLGAVGLGTVFNHEKAMFC